MAFTNSYDTTFPVDTQLANLLGADLRNFRVDVQQRMASISGLDAAKPTFNLDAQPANWNGILFFATDTGKIYKFTNPTWTDITNSFILSSSFLRVKNATQVNNTGNTTTNTIYTLALPVLTTNSFVRTTFLAFVSAANVPTIGMTLGGSANVINVGPLGTGNYYVRFVIEFWNQNNVAAQMWNGISFQMSPPPPSWGITPQVGAAPGTTAINTGISQNLLITGRVGNVADSITFFGVFTEIF